MNRPTGTPPPSRSEELTRLIEARRHAHWRRIRMLRLRVSLFAMIVFCAAMGTITGQMVLGHDPALSTASAAPTKSASTSRTSSAASNNGTSSSAASNNGTSSPGSGSTDSSSASQLNSSQPITGAGSSQGTDSSNSAASAPMTTRQS